MALQLLWLIGFWEYFRILFFIHSYVNICPFMWHKPPPPLPRSWFERSWIYTTWEYFQTSYGFSDQFVLKRNIFTDFSLYIPMFKFVSLLCPHLPTGIIIWTILNLHYPRTSTQLTAFMAFRFLDDILSFSVYFYNLESTLPEDDFKQVTGFMANWFWRKNFSSFFLFFFKFSIYSYIKIWQPPLWPHPTP